MSLKYEKAFNGIVEYSSDFLKTNIKTLAKEMSEEPVSSFDEADLKIYAKCNIMLYDFSGYCNPIYAGRALDALERYLELNIGDEEMQMAYIRLLENTGSIKKAYNCVRSWLNNEVTSSTAMAFLGTGMSRYNEFMTTEEREKFSCLF